MLRTTITAAALAAALLATAAAAHASPHLPGVTVHGLTSVTDRPDGGNGSPDPYWADDTFTRVIAITRTGGTPGAYTYTATLTDTGSFTAIKGAQTPNQGGPYAGETIASAVTGQMKGTAAFSFTASALPSGGFNGGVPLIEDDAGHVPADSTSTWYELAFPAGTVFGGAGIGAWSWTYDATTPAGHQQWIDASGNGAGDLPGDGNIVG